MKVTVQLDSTNNGFHGVGKDGLAAKPTAFQLTGAQPKVFPQFKFTADFCQCNTLDHTGPQKAQLSFPGFFEVQVKLFCNDQVDNRVAQKLQALIVLVAITTMGKCQQQTLRYLELITDTSLQLFQIRLRTHLPFISYSCWK